MKDSGKIIIVPRDPSVPFPWDVKTCDVSADITKLVIQNVDLEESVRRTYDGITKWSRETGQLSEQEKKAINKSISQAMLKRALNNNNSKTDISEPEAVDRQEIQRYVKWYTKNAIQQYVPTLTDNRFNALISSGIFQPTFKKPLEELPWNQPNFTDMKNLDNLVVYNIDFSKTIQDVKNLVK